MYVDATLEIRAATTPEQVHDRVLCVHMCACMQSQVTLVVAATAY